MTIQLELSEDEAQLLYMFLRKADILMEWNLHDHLPIFQETIYAIIDRLEVQLDP